MLSESETMATPIETLAALIGKSEPLMRYTVETLPYRSEAPVMSGVYTIRNPRTGNFYVGSSVDVFRRLRAHLHQLRSGKHHSYRMQNLWRKYQDQSLEFCIETIDLERQTSLAIEHYVLQNMTPAYNTATDAYTGMKGRSHTPESKAKLRAAKLGKKTGPQKPMDPARRAALNQSNSDMRKGVPRHDLRGRTHSEESKANMKAGAERRWASGSINGRTRRVEIKGVEYPSGRHAARAIGCKPASIVGMIKKGEGRYLDPNPVKRNVFD